MVVDSSRWAGIARLATLAVTLGAIWTDLRLAIPVVMYAIHLTLLIYIGPKIVYHLHLWRGALPTEAYHAEIQFRRRLARRIESLIMIN